MNDSPPPADNQHLSDQPSEKPTKKKPFQFSLKHLLILTFLVAIPFAAFTWGGMIGFILALPGLSMSVSVWFVVFGIIKKKKGWVPKGIGWFLLSVLFVILFLPAISSAPEAAMRAKCLNNLKYIGLALQMYHDTYGSFPPAYIADERGKPMHSWRVLLLPYLEEQDLYDRYDFNEPWDGPNNSKLGNVILDLYSCPRHPNLKGDCNTNYVVVIGQNTLWLGAEPRKISDVTDGTEYTIAVVEVAHSGIHWMEPRDLHLLQMKPEINAPTGQGLSSYHPHGVSTAFADGSTHWLKDDLDAQTFKALLTIDGGERIELDP